MVAAAVNHPDPESRPRHVTRRSRAVSHDLRRLPGQPVGIGARVSHTGEFNDRRSGLVTRYCEHASQRLPTASRLVAPVASSSRPAPSTPGWRVRRARAAPPRLRRWSPLITTPPATRRFAPTTVRTVGCRSVRRVRRASGSDTGTIHCGLRGGHRAGTGWCGDDLGLTVALLGTPPPAAADAGRADVGGTTHRISPAAPSGGHRALSVALNRHRWPSAPPHSRG